MAGAITRVLAEVKVVSAVILLPGEVFR